MSEAREILSQVDEGVEQDLYKLMRDPHTPAWLKKFFHKAVAEPDHAHTAQWLRKLADALDGGGGGGAALGNQAPTQAPPQSDKWENPDGTASPERQAARARDAAEFGQAPNSLPDVTAGSPNIAPNIPGANAQFSAPKPMDTDPIGQLKNIASNPEVPSWIRQIIQAHKGTDPQTIAKWLQWAADMAKDQNVAAQHLAGAMADPQVPSWVKQVLHIADSAESDSVTTGKYLEQIAHLYGAIKQAPKPPKARRITPKINPGGGQPQPSSPPVNKQPTAADLLGGRYDQNLSHGSFDDSPELPTHSNVKFDDEE